MNDCPSEHSPFHGSHHARFHRPEIPYHVISRVFQGRHLLRPCKKLNGIIAGVIGRAQELWPTVELFAVAFMSNHAHFLIQGPTECLPVFIGFIKREVSRRWGGDPRVNWPGTMWENYISTALPTQASQVQGLKYVLSQGVKEGLVDRPQRWPGVHAARPLTENAPLRGEWLDATSYAREVDRQRRSGRRRCVRHADHIRRCDAHFARLPAFSGLSVAEHQATLRAMLDDIVEEGHTLRNGRPALGAAAVAKVPPERRTRLAPQPWFEDRHRMIVWANPHDPSVCAYLDAYWDFQRAFREASRRFRQGLLASFPVGAFRPSTYVASTTTAGSQEAA